MGKKSQTDIDARIRGFENYCRERGLPVTMQRRVILEAVLRRADHPSADQIYDAVRTQMPQVSRTTIYRVLDALVEMGSIRRVCQTGAVRFDGKISRHHHLICMNCGKIFDLEDKELDRIPVPKKKMQGFEVDDFSVHFFGICPACQKQG